MKLVTESDLARLMLMANETLGYGHRPALANTIAAQTTQVSSSVPAANTLSGGVRTTVLPRVEKSQGTPRLVLEGRPRYEAVRPLGSGGQAEVTLTRDHDIERVVAIKRLLPENRDEGSVLRFAEEIRTVGQLEHPNIVPIHDVGVDDEGQYFFVMKYVDGETLEQILEKLRAGDERYLARYSPEYRLQICNEILRGVQHAHELGILHRDLKPSNLMVGPLGEVVIMDWGIAKKVEEAAAAGEIVGTPAYMSPEQAAGKPLDVRSDIYSLAVVFYEFLSLRHPRGEAKTTTAMLAAVANEPISKVQILNDFSRVGAPAALGHFVKHGLAHDPEERYPSVAGMRNRLEAVRDRRAPIECHVTFTQRVLGIVSRAADRHVYLLGVVLLLILAAAVFGVVKMT